MKSAVFYGKHDLRVEESAKPAVGRRDVLINVKACGVCGTDVQIYEGDKGAADVTLRLLRTLPRRNQPLLRAYDRLRHHC